MIVETFPLRVRKLFGTSGLASRMMIALDRGHSSVEDIIAGRNVPIEIVWIIDCLERTPYRRWPQRWRMARGDDAPEHIPHSPDGRGELVWSADELAPAAAALAAGASLAVAGETIGVSAQAVQQLISRGRLPPLVMTPARMARGAAGAEMARARFENMQRLIDNDDLSRRELAEKLGVTQRLIAMWVAKGRLRFDKTTGRERPGRQFSEIQAMIDADNLNGSELARRLSVTRAAVSRWRQRGLIVFPNTPNRDK